MVRIPQQTNLDREIEAYLEKRKTISNDGSGPAQLGSLFFQSHHNTDLGRRLKWDWQKLGNSPKKARQEKLDLKRKRKYKRKGKNPLTELNQESVS